MSQQSVCLIPHLSCPGMSDATFDDVHECLTTHAGQRVTVEVGCIDPRAEHLADYAVLQLQTTLGESFMVNDQERQVGVLRVPFLEGDDQRGGVEVRPLCLEVATIHNDQLKVWQHDVYFILAAVSFSL
jgi:hypothetical protein